MGLGGGYSRWDWEGGTVDGTGRGEGGTWLRSLLYLLVTSPNTKGSN